MVVVDECFSVVSRRGNATWKTTRQQEKRRGNLPACYSELVWFRFTALVLGTEIELPSLARVFSGCGEAGGDASAQRLN
jgi:hypothetical protein